MNKWCNLSKLSKTSKKIGIIYRYRNNILKRLEEENIDIKDVVLINIDCIEDICGIGFDLVAVPLEEIGYDLLFEKMEDIENKIYPRILKNGEIITI